MTRRQTIRAAEVLLALLLVPGVVTSVYLARLDPAVVQARVAGEVQRATGRDLAIGAMHLTLLPDLVIDADDVALANPAGFSRATMLTARHVHARVALLPLLGGHVVVRSLSLTGADLKLEQLPDGASNWRFEPTRPSVRLANAARTGGAGRMRLDSLTLLDVAISDGAVAWLTPGASGAMALPRASLREVNASSTMHVAANAMAGGEAVVLEGRLGGQSHLWNAEDRGAWPVDLAVHSDAGRIVVVGSITRPRMLSGYDVLIRADGADPGRLAALWPGWTVPRLRDVTLEARVIDRGNGVDVPRLKLAAGASDLSALVSGLALDRLAVEAPNIDGGNGVLANHLAASGRYAGQALTVDGTLGPIGRLFGRGQVTARAPIRLDGTATAAGATLTLHGRVAPTGDWAGTDLAAHATIPDLAALSGLAGRALPALRDIDAGGTAQSVRGELVLHDAHLTNPLIDVHVDGSARLGGRPTYRGQVTVARMSLDALRPMAMALAAPAAPQALAAPAAPRPETAAPPPSGPTLISDRPIGLAWFAGRDIDLTLKVADLVSNGVHVQSAATHIMLAAGRLDADPLSAVIAGAPIGGSLSLDTSRQPPAVAIDGRAAGIDLATVLALFGQPPAASGQLDVDISASGAGTTPHAIAGTLDGHLGLALVGARIDNRVLSGVLRALVPATSFGVGLPQTGRSDVACLATRIDARGGVGVPRAFLLDLGRLRLTAAGAIDFGAETFALRLRPTVRLGRAELVLPSVVDGPWQSPHLALEPASGASAVTIATGLIGSKGAAAGALLAGVAGAETLLDDAATGDCGRALAVARDPAREMAPPGGVRVPAAAPSRRQRAIELLRRLFQRGG